MAFMETCLETKCLNLNSNCIFFSKYGIKGYPGLFTCMHEQNRRVNGICVLSQLCLTLLGRATLGEWISEIEKMKREQFI